MIVIATLVTRHFEFMSAGETVDEAVEAMRQTWNAHVESFERRSGESMWCGVGRIHMWSWEDLKDDLSVM